VSAPRTPADAYITACPVGCDSTLGWTDIELPEGRLRRCPACGQWVSACTQARYAASMREFDVPEGTRPKPGAEVRRETLARRRLMLIARTLGREPAAIHLLDVGCSSGEFVRSAARLGFDAEGVEPAPAAARAAQQAGLNVRQGLVEDAAFPAQSFDALTLFEVIEHLREPLPLLRECHRILRPGGVLMVGTGNRASWTACALRERWEYFDIGHHGGHISFFSPASLRLVAERTGFGVERVATRNVRLVDRRSASVPAHLAGKVLSALLAYPARWFARGHDILGVFRRRG
jgi:SAM-dependent methyltransferase